MHLQIGMACRKYQLCIRDIKLQNTIGIFSHLEKSNKLFVTQQRIHLFVF